MESYVKQANPDTIEYTHSAAVSAGECIYVAGIGFLRASTAIAISTKGLYYTKGVFQFPITSTVTVSQGDKCYWDVSANKVIKSGMEYGDCYIGRAIADGSAAGGYVDIEVNNAKIDVMGGASGVLASGITIAHGLQTCVNVTLVTNATLETILLTHVLATDVAVANLADAPTDGTARLVWAKTNAGSVTVGLNTPAGTSTRIAYKVVRSI